MTTTFLNAESVPPRRADYEVDSRHRFIERDGWTSFCRAFIPAYASNCDAKITQAFQRTLEDILSGQKRASDDEQMGILLSRMDEHIERVTGERSVHVLPPKDIIKLERYMLGVRHKTGIFRRDQSPHELRTLVHAHSKSLYDKWVKRQQYPEEAFFQAPDLIDFVFHSHLHRHISYPAYGGVNKGHTVGWNKDGATLLVDGRTTQWSAMQRNFAVDKESERIYSVDSTTGKRVFWCYLEKGLVPHDVKKATPIPLRTLPQDQIPKSCQLQIVTTHDSPEKWNCVDRFLKGARHTFFRVIFREKFNERQDAGTYRPGEVYSWGWRPFWKDFNPLLPLESYQGYMQCPDNDEFLPQNFYETTLDITDEQALNLMSAAKNYKGRFNFVTNNCAGTTAQLLRDTGIIEIPTGSFMTTMWYQFLVPKYIRNIFDGIAGFFQRNTPDWLQTIAVRIGRFISAIFFAPIFLLFGAWRTNITDEALKHEDGLDEKPSKSIRALFNNIWDVFNPKSMTYDLTKNIYKWQKKQASTVFVKASDPHSKSPNGYS